MTSRWVDLDRPPLRAAALRRALVVDGSPWTDLRVVQETGSTNSDVAAAARAGAPEGLVVVAELQTEGRGRDGRSWSAPLRAGLAFSVLLRPPPATRAGWGWLPLLAGLAVVGPVRTVAGLDAGLKWPNDVLVGDRKLAGLLAEVVGGAVVLGIGLNVSVREEELPVPTATSLAIEGAGTTDREPMLRAVLRELGVLYGRFVEAAGDVAASGLVADYRAACRTLGRQVHVTLPGDKSVDGEAVAVDDAGRIVVRSDNGDHALAAGDVTHLR